MLKPKLFPIVFLFFVFLVGHGQSLSPFELDSEWIAKIESMVKDQKNVVTKVKKKLLIFSLHTGYKHWTIPIRRSPWCMHWRPCHWIYLKREMAVTSVGCTSIKTNDSLCELLAHHHRLSMVAVPLKRTNGSLKRQTHRPT